MFCLNSHGIERKFSVHYFSRAKKKEKRNGNTKKWKKRKFLLWFSLNQLRAMPLQHLFPEQLVPYTYIIRILSQLCYEHLNTLYFYFPMAFLYDETVMTLIYPLSRSHLHTEHIFYPLLSSPKGSNRQRNENKIDIYLYVEKKVNRMKEQFAFFLLPWRTIHSWFYLYCAFIARRTACIWSDKMNGEYKK